MSAQDRVVLKDDAPGGEIDLGAVGRALSRRKWWIFGPAIAVAALSFVGVNLITPKYKSESRILIEGRESVFFRPDAEKNGDRDRTVDPEAVTSQVQLALSRDVARAVIKDLKLAERPEFDSTLSGVSLMRYSLGFLGLAKDPLSMTPEERVLESYYERLAVFPVDKSRVFTVEFQSADPDLAAQVANSVADNYLNVQQGVRQEQTRAASRWLGGEIDLLRKRVAEAEAKVEEFRGKTNLFVVSNGGTLSSQTLSESNRDLAVARSQKADLESKAHYIREVLKRGGAVEYSDMINSEVIRRLNEQRVTLRAQLAEQSSTLLDNHPRIKELKAQIADLDRQSRDEASRLARSFENDARIAGARVEALQSALDQLKQQASSTNGQDVELRALERDAKSQRDLLESYLAKYREASARDNLATPGDARIISRAAVSNTPYFPKKLPIVLIAALATLLVSAGFITTGELLAGTADRGPVPVEAVVEPVVVADEPARTRRWLNGLTRAKVDPQDAVLEPPVEPAVDAGEPAPKRRWSLGGLMRSKTELQGSVVEPADDEAVPMPVDLAPKRRWLLKGLMRSKAEPQESTVEPAFAPVVEAPMVPEPPVEAEAALAVEVPADGGIAIAHVAQALREGGEQGKRLAVIGATQGCGTTRTAVALARALAKDASVLLLDLSLEQPELAAITLDPHTPGIADLVHGAATFGEIITRDRASRVQVVPAGDVGGDAAAVYASESLSMAVDALAQNYDHLIIDAGATADAPAERIARLASCGLLVATGRTPESANAMRDHLVKAGFSDVAVFAGTPPALDAESMGSVAA